MTDAVDGTAPMERPDDGEGGHMTLMEHLAELRNRLIKTVVAVAVCAVVCWILYPFILDLLLEPYCKTFPVEERIDSQLFGPDGGCNLFVTSPLEPFSVRITLVAYSGLALAMPVLLWQGWRFIAPGLYRHEKRYAIPFVAAGVLLFFLGVGLAYWSLPRALDFLKDIGGPDLVSLFSPKEYLGFVVKMMVAFGVAFQFPIVLIGLQVMGVVENRTLRKVRSYAVVGIVILVAVITPSGDPFTLMALSIPMYAFYEIAILWGVLVSRRQRKREAARS
jgi:sec-independent protein translocase protein TatC